MAIPGQRFELDLDAENFTFNPLEEREEDISSFQISDVQERDDDSIPPPPAPSSSRTGFPEPKARKTSSFKQQRQRDQQNPSGPRQSLKSADQPSKPSVVNRSRAQKTTDHESTTKQQISDENDRMLASMSPEEIEDARRELLSTLSPSLIERAWKRANIDDNLDNQDPKVATDAPQRQDEHQVPTATISPDGSHQQPSVEETDENPPPPHPDPSNEANPPQPPPSIHFPRPPRNPSDYTPLDPSSATFLTDLRTTYFPSLPHNPSPSNLDWLQPTTTSDLASSPYAPHLPAYPSGTLRFSFTGTLLPPSTSLDLPVHLGLHHHNDAPSSAGYTIPELALLSRSSLPNQRCIAYQTLGRILYKLGHGDFGPDGTELTEALWDVVEKERVVDVMLTEANKDGNKGGVAGGGHVSARAYATEALWLWRKGNNGSRGLRKVSERKAV